MSMADLEFPVGDPDIDGPYSALDNLYNNPDPSPMSSSIIKVGRLNNRLIATLPSQMCRDLGIVVGCEAEWVWRPPELGVNGTMTLMIVSTPKVRAKAKSRPQPKSRPKPKSKKFRR